jgi:flagellar biosynthesis/type III secretory pathway protein FliH
VSVSHRFRNFGGAKAPESEPRENGAEALEDQKLEAFEAGYKAGWDDATKAQSDEKEKLSAELGQNLLDMSFTYHEALSKLTVSLEPAMRQIIEKLLPEIVRTALGTHILEQVQAVLSEQLGQPVEIVVHPDNMETVQSIVKTELPEPFEVVGEASLGEGQAFIRIGASEHQIDLDTMVSEVSKAMKAFFHETALEADNG